MGRKILIECAGNFSGRALNIAVKSSHYGCHVFATDRLVKIVAIGPDGPVRLGVMHLEIKAKTSDECLPRDFLEVVKTPTQQVIAACAAAECVDVAIVPGVAKLT